MTPTLSATALSRRYRDQSHRLATPATPKRHRLATRSAE
jgi:hypothetical protein